jgi:hypothetical protein
MSCCGNSRRPTGHPDRSRCVLAVAICLLAAGCSTSRLTAEDAQRLIESSARFNAPNILTVRPQYCATVDAPDENVTAGAGRLSALESAGAIRIARRAAAPDECTSLPGPMRERVVISLGPSSGTFNPRPVDGGGWEFTLARRRFVSVGEITVNRDDDPTIARAVYRWAWRAELLGQLLQTSEEPINAQATFIRMDGAWNVRDVGF